MLAKRIIPCLDIRQGRVVKGVRFVEIRDAGDPVEVAAAYDAAGADELCFLDINASHEQRGILIDLVARVADRIMIPFSVGGGSLRSRTCAAFWPQVRTRSPSTVRRLRAPRSSRRRPSVWALQI